MTVQELESTIYDRYYDENPDGDARFDLRSDMIEAKNNGKDAIISLFCSYGFKKEGDF